MLRIFILLFVTAFGLQLQAQTELDKTIISGGLTRQYHLYIPANYHPGANVPLLFNLHGHGSNSFQQEFYGNFNQISDTAGFIICLPNGTLDNTGLQYWNSGFGGSVDDVAFISNLIDTISSHYSIDLTRVYSTGMSNGSFMSHTLACQLSNRIAAIASVAGSMTPVQYATCNPPRPVPVLHVHGTADNTVPYHNSSFSIDIDSLMNFWAAHNGSSNRPAFNILPDINTNDSCTVNHYVWSVGQQNTNSELYKVIGGGHTWPGAIFNIGVTNQDFNASMEIWRFLRKYRLISAGTVQVSGNQDFKVYPNPAGDILNIDIDGNVEGLLTVTDITGAVRKQISIKGNGQLSLDITDLTKGFYILKPEVEGRSLSPVKFIKE